MKGPLAVLIVLHFFFSFYPGVAKIVLRYFDRFIHNSLADQHDPSRKRDKTTWLLM